MSVWQPHSGPRCGMCQSRDLERRMTHIGGGMAYQFGDCELDPGLHELRRRGRVSAIEPKVFDLLLYLVENRDRMISKDELNQRIW